MVLASRPSSASTNASCTGGAGGVEPPAEGNQYASKTELLEWINGLLQLQLGRLEQFSSGAVFCQMLDAYFSEAIPMHKVNYAAVNEYEAVPNYKVLQQGFTAIGLTREIPIHKLARGSRTELLELLQYLYRFLLKLKARESYNARERRALGVRGGTDTVPLPSWLAGSQAAGRGTGMNRSSGNWGSALEGDKGHTLRTSTSTSGSPTHKRSSSIATGSPDKAEAAAAAGSSPSKRPAAPSRVTSASTNRAPAAPAAAGAAAATGGKGAVQEAQPEDEAGMAVFQVLAKEESSEVVSAQAPAGEPGSTTRLVIPDDVISSSMIRPLSAAAHAQLELCLGASEEAIRVLQRTCVNMTQISTTLSTCTDSVAYRGKIHSLLDASTTAATHVGLMLSDAAAVLAGRAEASVKDLKPATERLQQELDTVTEQLFSCTSQLHAAIAAKPLTSQATLNMQLTQLQRELASTAALDGSLRALATAYSALLGLCHKEGAAAARQFLSELPVDSNSSSGSAGGPAQAPPGSMLAAEGLPPPGATPDVAAGGTGGAAGQTGPSRVLKLGDCSMKRLRNGDIYKGRYQGLRKNGEGSYAFVNGDWYEGGFKDDRMAGSGVYEFAPEGRYEGDWQAALYEGHGSETFAKGSTYHGQYSAGMRHGWGLTRFFNGDYYEGQWSKGLRDGVGMQQCTDDSNYCGQYRRGKRHGYGVYSFPNGDQFLGEYVDDIPHGYGVYVFVSGQKYEGAWQTGKKHGWSIYTVETGQRWAGSWAEGKPQWVHPVGATEPITGGQAGAEAAAGAVVTPEVTENLSHAAAACKNAQEARALAQAKLFAHWAPDGEVQQDLKAAVAWAKEAANTAQTWRRKAQQLAARLDAAAFIITSGSRNARMEVVSHQLEAISLDC